MVAWHHQNLAFVQTPLATSVCWAEPPLPSELQVMETASLLWTAPTLDTAANIESGSVSVPARGILCSLAAAPAVWDGEWRGHSLCLLANALHPVRHDLAPLLWSQVETQWLLQLRDLVLAVTSFESLPLEPSTYSQALHATGCFRWALLHAMLPGRTWNCQDSGTLSGGSTEDGE